MAAAKIEVPQAIYQLKVTLEDIAPPIWRRLQVPAEMSLEQLHRTLQAALGWEECHLHEFRIGRETFGAPVPRDMLMGMPAPISEKKVRVSDALPRVRAKGAYIYDFGDSWEHEIRVEKILMPEKGVAYPTCIGGERRGPPEDCGGIPGYYNLLEVLSDPEHEEHEDLRQWAGPNFDPESFSVEAVNRRLLPLQRRWAKA